VEVANGLSTTYFELYCTQSKLEEDLEEAKVERDKLKKKIQVLLSSNCPVSRF